MFKSVIAASVFVVVAVSAGSASAQGIINQTVPGASVQREMTLAPFREGADRLRQFESVRRLNEYSPAERERARRRASQLIARSNTSCDMVNAVQLGQTERRRDIVEVSCSNGYGYLLIDGSTPTAYDCLQLAQAATVVRASSPRAEVGSQCTLEENGGTG